jgi:hypothetical protein
MRVPSDQIGGRLSEFPGKGSISFVEIVLLTEAMAMKQFDHYCKTLRCKMSKEACLGRQLLAFKTQNYRIDAQTVLASQGFYPECYACVRGRSLAHSCGINIRLLRRQMTSLRARVEESPWIGYCIHRQFR